MKKIKFRGWDTLSPKMYNGHSLTLQSDGTLMFLDTDGEWKQDENERWVVMQFTGLRDKNGKEIYEGDIVKWHDVQIEYQTHYGNNIPNGSYTEPIDVKAITFVRPVVYAGQCFTTDVEEPNPENGVMYTFPLGHQMYYDRQLLNNIFSPTPYSDNSIVEDDEFLEIAQGVAENLNFNFTSIADFIEKLNGLEVIGNIFENPDLLK